VLPEKCPQFVLLHGIAAASQCTKEAGAAAGKHKREYVTRERQPCATRGGLV